MAMADVKQIKPKILFQDSTAQPRALMSKAASMWAASALSPKPILKLYIFDGNQLHSYSSCQYLNAP